jgi:hypothetical protein
MKCPASYMDSNRTPFVPSWTSKRHFQLDVVRWTSKASPTLYINEAVVRCSTHLIDPNDCAGCETLLCSTWPPLAEVKSQLEASRKRQSLLLIALVRSAQRSIIDGARRSSSSGPLRQHIRHVFSGVFAPGKERLSTASGLRTAAVLRVRSKISKDTEKVWFPIS